MVTTNTADVRFYLPFLLNSKLCLEFGGAVNWVGPWNGTSADGPLVEDPQGPEGLEEDPHEASWLTGCPR